MPLVSYYTHLYAVQLAMEYHKQNSKNQVVRQYVITLLNETEQKKAQLGEVQNPKDQFESFCTALFVKADTEDRKEGSTKLTAQTFLVTSYFIEAMRVFEELPPDWEEKRVYCKWKANDISKALKSGLVPQRGGPGEAQAENEQGEVQAEQGDKSLEKEYDDLTMPSPPTGFPSQGSDLYPPPPPAQTRLPPPSQPSEFYPPPPAQTRMPPPSQPSGYDLPPPSQPYSTPQPQNNPPQPSKPATIPSGAPKGQREIRAAIEKAKKEAQYAIQELEYKNVAPAIKNLQNALNIQMNFNKK
eukprot:CAMPEP_0202940566 /NCGR_PEP_ID=MMETSP1395-20130829/701_1 /ASSEMBLY_ACC=CAM_ASM_000871 /TAXON_ID=5961 /ORGANISM="Blepharisma japonicum, Strain Stock R1072" /LENGTH=298 /DNA_ID=CAMNT_0049635119 /DNA_START=90 /DNA_END=984 /DNA_ORIENTATION=-